MNDLKEKVKLVGWVSAAFAFVALTLSYFNCPYMVQLTALSLLVAGTALLWGERAKSVIVFEISGLLYFAVMSDSDFDVILRVFISFLLYIGVVFYFKPTRLNKVASSSVLKLLILAIIFILLVFLNLDKEFLCLTIMALIAVFHLVFVACFISRKYLPLEEVILKFENKFLGRNLFKGVFKGLSFVFKGIFVDIPKTVWSSCFSADKFLKSYAYSVFLLGVISAAVLFLWASPVKEAGEKLWNQHMVTMAIMHVVVCAIWGCFILSQISCAIKLRGRQIAAGAAPVHLLIASFLCKVLAAEVFVGIVYLLVESPSDMTSDWCISVTFALMDVPSLLGIAEHCNPKTAVTLSAIVTIWHLIGASFVALLIRDNIARVRSLENESDQN